MKELDVLLQRWLDQRYEGASEAQRDDFAALLERQDPEILAWLLAGQRPPEPEIARAIREVLACSGIMSADSHSCSEPSPTWPI
jgi:antitoxin CptB